MKFTFGKTPAAIRLENLVKDNPSARRKVSRLLSGYTKQLLLATSAKDPATVRLLFELLCKYHLSRIEVLENLEENVRTYTENVIKSRYRVFLHQFNEIVPLMEKQGLTSTKSKV